jgi:hypothetical protein
VLLFAGINQGSVNGSNEMAHASACQDMDYCCRELWCYDYGQEVVAAPITTYRNKKEHAKLARC